MGFGGEWWGAGGQAGAREGKKKRPTPLVPAFFV
jgi:hypothetical protein